jgi:hypothetical protein
MTQMLIDGKVWKGMGYNTSYEVFEKLTGMIRLQELLL